MITRRNMLLSSAATLAAGSVLNQLAAAQTAPSAENQNSKIQKVFTPNGSTLPFKLLDGVKVFHLTAEPIEHEFAPGLISHCWGYNGSTPGPTIEAIEGDRIRIYVTNKLPAPTTIHWHGLRLPNGMDGVNGLTQEPIPAGETFKYEFTLRQNGTFMYHPHFDEMTQQGMGMMGMFIIHPRQAPAEQIDRDFCLMLSEWKIVPGASRPDTTEMVEFNIFTINSKVFPATDPLVAKKGERVRIRFGNLSAMDHHPIHLHGYDFVMAETDGGVIPESARYRANTVLVPVGGTRAIELVASDEGDWAMHCHMTHHTMNQMGHNAPNVLGTRDTGMDTQLANLIPGYMTMGRSGMGEMLDMQMAAPKNSIPMRAVPGPFGPIDMGGMFTILKVRQNVEGFKDPGWYKHPAGTVASPASVQEMNRDLS